MQGTTHKKITLLLIILCVITLFIGFDLHQYLTLDYLKSQHLAFNLYYATHPWATILSYTAIYILVTALSLPGATIMTLAGGAVFGLGSGTLIVSFASSIGATLAFLASRYMLQNWIQKKYNKRLNTINQGIEKEGALYLFTLRLIPIFPFFLINLLMGITTIRTWQFYLVSQIGMLPATLIYVNAGDQLSSITSLTDIISPQILLSFALLGIFPLLAKKIVNLIQYYRNKK